MAKSTLGDDIDALFAVPLTGFTGARNALAARLKQGGRGDEAERVKALGKPSVSAWAVNQLYWKHRKAFDRLIETGQRMIAAAKASLQNAERVLKEVRAKARDAEVALKKANAEAKEAEKHKREAEELLEKASAASEEARRSARSVEADAAAAKKALENAERTVEKASRELRLLRGH